MGLVDEAQCGIADDQCLAKRMRIKHGRIKWRTFKGISEPPGKAGERFRASVERYRGANMLRHLAQIIDPVAMIGMVVGDNHTGQIGGFRGEQLLTHVGTAINQQMLARAVEQDR